MGLTSSGRVRFRAPYRASQLDKITFSLIALIWHHSTGLYPNTAERMYCIKLPQHNIAIYWSRSQGNTKSWRWELIPRIVWVRWDNRGDGDAIADGIRIGENARIPFTIVPPGSGPEYALGPILARIGEWVVSKIRQNLTQVLFVCLFVCQEKVGGRCWSVNMHVYAREQSPVAEAGGGIFMRATSCCCSTRCV